MDSAERLRQKDQATVITKERSGDFDARFSPVQFGEEEKIHRKSFFKKKASGAGLKKAQSNQSLHEESTQQADWLVTRASQNLPRSPSPRLSITDDDAVMMAQKQAKMKEKSFGFSNWFKSDKGKTEGAMHADGQSAGVPSEDAVQLPDTFPVPTEKLVRKSSFQGQRGTIKVNQKSSGHVSLTFLKARKRVEGQFKFVFGKGKTKHSFDEPLDISRRNSYVYEHGFRDTEMILLKEAKLVSLPAVKEGMLRFQVIFYAPPAHSAAAAK